MSVTVVSVRLISVTVITRMVDMVRWEPGARERLQSAALELYAARGFEQTTAADIAESVGLTERTFFRHFADKREVLFDGQDRFQQVFLDGMAAAPDVSSLGACSSTSAAKALLCAPLPCADACRARATIFVCEAMTGEEATKMIRRCSADVVARAGPVFLRRFPAILT